MRSLMSRIIGLVKKNNFKCNIVYFLLSISFNIIFVLNRTVSSTILFNIHSICFGRDLNVCLGAQKPFIEIAL